MEISRVNISSPTYEWSMQSPVGRITLLARGGALIGLAFESERYPLNREGCIAEATPVLLDAERQIHEYFGGWRQAFDLPLNPQGTEFQRKVWKELVRIPFGLAISYQELANRIGNPKSTRAVGLANGKNPIALLIPCHRVIGSDRSLTGFGGGLDRKAYLLNHEGIGFRQTSASASLAKQFPLPIGTDNGC
jgi:methylated-DNA-[protein]-cysteine S-methyltransferase